MKGVLKMKRNHVEVFWIVKGKFPDAEEQRLYDGSYLYWVGGMVIAKYIEETDELTYLKN